MSDGRSFKRTIAYSFVGKPEVKYEIVARDYSNDPDDLDFVLSISHVVENGRRFFSFPAVILGRADVEWLRDACNKLLEDS